ncbi:hypothetical protein GY45DRAFT_255844 [Cubamyces sp. BRFM 1775]|nr:hypothetical protein GY45DRAFT_255844 [Cubamyces sp. BRFM 1775]
MMNMLCGCRMSTASIVMVEGVEGLWDGRTSRPAWLVGSARVSVEYYKGAVLRRAMSLKAELETWAAALQAYDAEDFEKSLELFSQIADSSKILTNIGLIYATLGEHEAAVEQFTAATELDQYLAVALML